MAGVYEFVVLKLERIPVELTNFDMDIPSERDIESQRP